MLRTNKICSESSPPDVHMPTSLNGEIFPANKTKTKILIIGDATVSTGFSRVIRNIFEPLLDDFEFHQIGINYHGDPNDYPWLLYPAIVGGDIFGTGRIQPLIEKIQPNAVFALNDLWTLGSYMDVLKHYRDHLKIILYCPIESKLIDYSHVARLNGAHKIIAYTQFGRQELEKGVSWAKSHHPEMELESTEIDVIFHGVDNKLITDHEVEEETYDDIRLNAKKKLWPEFEDIETSFIVLNANRNQPRKRIDLTMKGFSLFAKSKPDNVRLYLHMGLEDVGWNIIRLAEYLGIENRLILSSTSRTIPSISDEQMKLVYEACDVGLNTSSAEGWGLVNFEHAVTKAPQVITAHEVARELWADHAKLIEPIFTLVEPQSLVTSHIISPEDIATALERLYQDLNYRRSMGLAAYKNATQIDYSWHHISMIWKQHFKSLLPTVSQS